MQYAVTQYSVIEGSFYILGYAPDGDTVRFKAHSDSRWFQVRVENPQKFQKYLKKVGGVVPVRLQSIDALETHYTPNRVFTPPKLHHKRPQHIQPPHPGDHSQPSNIGKEASEALLHQLGVEDIQWTNKRRTGEVRAITLRSSALGMQRAGEEVIPGYVIVHLVDQHHRPLGWVFPGKPPVPDGKRLDAGALGELIQQSINYRLVRQGLAYPYFYMAMPGPLRDVMAEAAQQAHEDAKNGSDPQAATNVWALDKLIFGVDIAHLRHVTENYVIFPYLFRKIIQHWHYKNMEIYWEAIRRRVRDTPTYVETIDFAGFFERANPDVYIISQQDYTQFDKVLTIEQQRVKLAVHPYDLVFLH